MLREKTVLELHASLQSIDIGAIPELLFDVAEELHEFQLHADVVRKLQAGAGQLGCGVVVVELDRGRYMTTHALVLVRVVGLVRNHAGRQGE